MDIQTFKNSIKLGRNSGKLRNREKTAKNRRLRTERTQISRAVSMDTPDKKSKKGLQSDFASRYLKIATEL